MGAYRTAVSADSPYLHYEFNGGYTDTQGVGNAWGTSTITGTANSTNGTSSVKTAGGSYTWTDGRYTNAAEAALGANLNLNNALTIECWFKPVTLLATGVHNIIRHDDNRYWLRVSSKKLHLNLTTTGGTAYVDLTGATNLVQGTLYHLAITWDGTFGRVYVNGVLDGTSSNRASTLNILTTGATYLGTGSEPINGELDELAIYRSCLTAAQLLNHYNIGIGDVTVAAGTTTNVTLDAKDATVSVTSTVTIAAGTTTNVALDAKDATVSVTTDATIAAGTTTNVAVAGQPATVPSITILPTVSNIAIAEPAPTLFVGITISVSVSNVGVDAQDAIIPFVTVFAGTTQNIGIAASDILELYPALVTLNNPVHYYRMIEDSPSTNIKDYGSNPIHGTSPNAVHADYESGIAGDPTSESLELVVATSLSTAAVDIIKYSSPIFETKDNLSYEFWIKTSSNDGIILAIDATNSTVSSQTFRNTIAIGLTDGYLSLIKLQNAGTTTITKTNSKLNTNVWNHVVLVKKTFTDYIKYSSYVNNEETNIIISIAEFLSYTISTNRQSIGNYVNDSNVPQNDFNYTIYLDEIALYESALSESDISNHYNTGRGSGAVSVSVTTSNIAVDAKDATREIIINPSTANVSVEAKNISLKASGTIRVNVNIGGITIDEQAITVSLTASISIDAQVSNLTIDENINKVSIKDVEFKFISTEDTSLGASDCEALTSFEFGGLLYLQEKKLLFRIGNLATNNCNFNISIYSNETEILDALTLSSDNITYSDTLSINGIKPNSITDPIWVKIDTNNIETLGTGTFLVDVEQIYV